jgi:hypothetical protein
VLREDVSAGSTGIDPVSGVGLLLVGEGRPYTAREIAGSLGLPVVARLAWDPASAEVIAAGADPGRRFRDQPPGAQCPRGDQRQLGADRPPPGPARPARSVLTVVHRPPARSGCRQ